MMSRMNILFMGAAFVAASSVAADRLENTYLPPFNAQAAGGSSFLTPPANSYIPPSSDAVIVEAARSRTLSSGNRYSPPPANSYIPPASGPVTVEGRTSSGSYGGGVPSARTYSGYSARTPAAILRYNNDNNGDGSYRFNYETEDHISRDESGQLTNVGSDQESSVVKGSYSYTAPDGVTYTVNYVADENGFRATGDHLPTPPPVPIEILKSLDISDVSSRSFAHSSSNQPDRQYLAPRVTNTKPPGYHY